MEDEKAAKLQEAVEAWRKETLSENNETKGDLDSWRKIMVCARIRPVCDSERAGLGRAVLSRDGVQVNEFECVSALNSCVVLHSELKRIGVSTGNVEHRAFKFDATFKGRDEDGLYRACVAPLLSNAKKGSDCCVIAYGQTASGKTHTTIECRRRALEDLFDGVDQASVEISCFEVGPNDVVDLLADRAPLTLREDEHGCLCEGASRFSVTCVEAALALVDRADTYRHSRSTAWNARSSRSHAIFVLHFGDSKGRLRLVDLAGSERRAEALHHDVRALQETKSINAALSCLKDCIRALHANSHHVPYRRNPLTRLLKPALQRDCENGLTIFIAHLAPTNLSFQHTRNTLDYCTQMRDVATDADRRNALIGPEQWTPAKLQAWVATIHNARFAPLSPAFASISGKVMATMWRGEFVRRINAAKGSDEDADIIYDAFFELNKRAKLSARSRGARKAPCHTRSTTVARSPVCQSYIAGEGSSTASATTMPLDKSADTS